MRYSQIELMCRPRGNVRGCPHDGLGCTGAERCSINSADNLVRQDAFEATEFGPTFRCAKREYHLRIAQNSNVEKP